MKILAISLEYVRVLVSASIDGATVDPTNDAVRFAFKTGGQQPSSGDFLAGSWEVIGGVPYARILVGPGGTIQLAAGRYDVYLKITDNPEVPVRLAGPLTVS